MMYQRERPGEKEPTCKGYVLLNKTKNVWEQLNDLSENRMGFFFQTSSNLVNAF